MIRQEDLAVKTKFSAVKVSRRRFLAGAGATVAVVAAGGSAAGVVLHERSGPRTSAGGATTLGTLPPTGPNPLADGDTRIRHLLRRTTFAPLPPRR